MVMGAMVLLIAVGVFYIIDPTLAGLLKKSRHEGFENNFGTAPPSMNGENAGMFQTGGADAEAVNANPNNAMNHVTGNNTNVTEGFADLTPADMPFPAAEKPANCYPKNQLSPPELLPNDPNSKWSQVNPQAAGDIAGKNFLNAGALVGVNTVGQSLKNASWDLRSEPPNPQVSVSPWLNSTYEPDLSRRPLEIA